MNIDRIKKLKEFVEQEPNDPFNIYALALEYLNSDSKTALTYFDQLLTEHPNYLPTYYHSAETYWTNNEREKAETIYQNGIKLAKKIGDNNTLRELQNAYNNFLFDED